MKAVFADTSYYVALLGANDAHHRAAVEWGERLLGQIVVTEYVIVEPGSALSGLQDRDLYVPVVKELRNDAAKDALTTDRHFVQAGFRALLREAPA